MLHNKDIRGITAYASMTLLPNKKWKGLLENPIPIIEKPKKPFKGLTSDMRGRDGMGYAVCKDFKEILPKSDLSSRLVNPVQRFEQYPQPKPKIDKNYTMDIRPSELDMLSKLKDDNTKMLIIQLLQAKAIGSDLLNKGTPDQQARLQIAYDNLRARYEQIYRNSRSMTNSQLDSEAQLNSLINIFKEQVHSIYGVSLEQLNSANTTTTAVQQLTTTIANAQASQSAPLQPGPTLAGTAASLASSIYSRAASMFSSSATP